MVDAVITKNSVVPLEIPDPSTMDAGSLAVNVTDGALYTKDYAGIVVRVEGDTGNDSLASAATLALGAEMAAFIDVTGTTTITAVTLREGQTRTVRFTGALTLTHGSSLVLPGEVDITTAAGDYATFRGYAGGVVRCLAYTGIAGVLAKFLAVTDDTSTNATMYPVWVDGTSGSRAAKVASSKLTFNPSTGLLSTTLLALSGLLDISGASAGQIKFPATQNASSNANTIDDYEEGTFSPIMTLGGASTGMTYSQQFGYYTKIGHRVFFSIVLTLTAKGSSTGTVLLGGLPFACLEDAATGAAVGYYDGFSGLTGAMCARVSGSGTVMNLAQMSATTVSNLTDARITDTSRIFVSGHYQIS